MALARESVTPMFILFVIITVFREGSLKMTEAHPQVRRSLPEQT